MKVRSSLSYVGPIADRQLVATAVRVADAEVEASSVPDMAQWDFAR